MDKLLTISIAAFNVEEYLEETLNSICIESIIDCLEVFVVDDGGTDKSLSIAQKYAQKYPGSIFPIHKENGGYGSTVNYSIMHATGRYFKLLDGDDWYQKEGIENLVAYLKKTDIESIITNVAVCVEQKKQRQLYPFISEISGIPMRIDEAQKYPVVAMWAYTFKTDIVKKAHVALPEHCLYTDQLFVVHCLSEVQSVVYLDDLVYCWRIGRDDQSNNIKSVTKHYRELIEVSNSINEYYSNLSPESQNPFLLKRVAAYYSVTVAYLCKIKHSHKMLTIIKDWELETRTRYPDIYIAANNAKKLRVLRLSGYNLYWLIK